MDSPHHEAVRSLPPKSTEFSNGWVNLKELSEGFGVGIETPELGGVLLGHHPNIMTGGNHLRVAEVVGEGGVVLVETLPVGGVGVP